MRPDALTAMIKDQLAARSKELTLRYSVTLTGELAEAFRRMHQELGGEAVMSRGQLTAWLLRYLLIDGAARPARRAGSHTPSAEPGAVAASTPTVPGQGGLES
jgi:hypothetical protein